MHREKCKIATGILLVKQNTIPPSRYRVPPPFAQRRRKVALASNEAECEIFKKPSPAGSEAARGS